MRRFLAIVLMLLVPLQSAWSAAESIHGHAADAAAALGFHSHHGAHDHHDDGVDGHNGCAAADHDGGYDDDGHYGGHYHPVFSVLVIEPDLEFGAAVPAAPPLRPPVSFTSHIPLLFDWPPAVSS
ncbi:MAG: hypothetical protein HZC24_07945 [Rhodocyclales bacterium]|nr:hypothetical protein [Rhodocyclales bacterium]